MIRVNSSSQHNATLDANFEHLKTAILAARSANHATTQTKDRGASIPTVAVHGGPGCGKTTQSTRLGDAFDGLPIVRFDHRDHLPDERRPLSVPSLVIIDNLNGNSGANRAANIRRELPAGSVLVLLSQDADTFPPDAIRVAFSSRGFSR